LRDSRSPVGPVLKGNTEFSGPDALPKTPPVKAEQNVPLSLDAEINALVERLADASAARDGWAEDLHLPLEEVRCELDTLIAAVDQVGSQRMSSGLEAALELLHQAHRCMEQQLFLPALLCAVAARQTLRRLRMSVRLTLRAGQSPQLPAPQLPASLPNARPTTARSP
jgi:hypothetical protein